MSDKTEVLSFSFEQMYLSRRTIRNKAELVSHIKKLAQKYNLPATKIIFNHDYEEAEYKAEFKDNFKKNGTYSYLKEVLK